MRLIKKGAANTKFLATAVTVGVVLSGYVWWSGRNFKPDIPPPLLTVSRSNFASLVLDFGDGQKREFRGEVTPNMSALDALSLSSDAGKLHVSYLPAKGGVEVAVIDGKKAQREKHWIFYVNGERGENPATHKVRPGDVIEWRYE